MTTSPDDLAYPSYQEGYAPQRGLTKREDLEFRILAAIVSGGDPRDVREIGREKNGCETIVRAARIITAEYFRQKEEFDNQ